jgi:hypothetical protein
MPLTIRPVPLEYQKNNGNILLRSITLRNLLSFKDTALEEVRPLNSVMKFREHIEARCAGKRNHTEKRRPLLRFVPPI